MSQYKDPATILLAEDEHSLRALVQMILSENGYTIITAKDGAEALAKARAHPGTIHLLLSDIDMPEKTGIEVAFQLARDRPETGILLMSGASLATVTQKPAWNLLRKPFSAETLLQKVRTALAQQTS